jgi:hypothetical protein
MRTAALVSLPCNAHCNSTAVVQTLRQSPFGTRCRRKCESCWRFAPQCCAWQSVSWRRRVRRRTLRGAVNVRRSDEGGHSTAQRIMRFRRSVSNLARHLPCPPPAEWNRAIQVAQRWSTCRPSPLPNTQPRGRLRYAVLSSRQEVCSLHRRTAFQECPMPAFAPEAANPSFNLTFSGWLRQPPNAS